MDSNRREAPVPATDPGQAARDRPTAGPRSLAFATTGLPRHHQHDAWAAAHHPMVSIDPPADGPAGFEAEMSAWTLGPFIVTRTRAPATCFSRDRAQIRRDQIDHWDIGYLRRGSLCAEVSGDIAQVDAGLPYVHAMHEPCRVERSTVDWIHLFVPRDAFPGLGPALEACRMRALDWPTGRLLGGFLVDLATELPTLAGADLPRVAEATRALVAAAVAPGRDSLDAGRPQIEAVQLTRIKALIRDNLRSPRLTPERICRLAGVSRSQLYRLFEPLGGVARHIHAERLRQVRRALADPLGQREIHRIAEDAGFYDASTFSRAFRREFGCTPSELRAAVRSGAAPPDAVAQRAGAEAACRLIDMLRLP